jgi:hypothetical protein
VSDATRPPEHEPGVIVESEGGDAACWAHRVCQACGRLNDAEHPVVCENCGARFG